MAKDSVIVVWDESAVKRLAEYRDWLISKFGMAITSSCIREILEKIELLKTNPRIRKTAISRVENRFETVTTKHRYRITYDYSEHTAMVTIIDPITKA